MPFDPTTGIYTPPDGAENAFPGETIRSATWNAIFTDISEALSQIGPSIFDTPTNVTGAAYTVTATDTYIRVNHAGAVAIQLGDADARANLKLRVKDVSGAAGSNPITMTRLGSDTIDGQTTLQILADWGTWELLPLNGGNWNVTP